MCAALFSGRTRRLTRAYEQASEAQLAVLAQRNRQLTQDLGSDREGLEEQLRTSEEELTRLRKERQTMARQLAVSICARVLMCEYARSQDLCTYGHKRTHKLMHARAHTHTGQQREVRARADGSRWADA